MTSLAEAYGGHVGEVVSRERLYLGVGTFLVGVALTAAGMVLATTDVAAWLGLERMPAWRRAGVLAGVGVPAVIGGVFAVLPSSKRIKAAATIGAGISLLGVALFWYAYPAHWAGWGRELTLEVTAIYFFGTLTFVWCLFVGIANFKRRNDPGGTVSLKILKEGGETKIVEVDRSELEDGSLGEMAAAGGVGLVGSTPDGSVETQTNDPTASGGGQSTGRPATPAGSSSASGTHGSGGSTAKAGGKVPTGSTSDGWTTTGNDAHPAQTRGTASDGGADDADITSLRGGEIQTPRDSARQYADRYCGNCEHFQYVRTENGMQPYCGFHGEEMDDMEACEEWEPNH